MHYICANLLWCFDKRWSIRADGRKRKARLTKTDGLDVLEYTLMTTPNKNETSLQCFHCCQLQALLTQHEKSFGKVFGMHLTSYVLPPWKLYAICFSSFASLEREHLARKNFEAESSAIYNSAVPMKYNLNIFRHQLFPLLLRNMSKSLFWTIHLLRKKSRNFKPQDVKMRRAMTVFHNSVHENRK